MIKTIFSFLLLFFALQTFAQTTYENSVFGFKIEKPESWSYYGSTEFDNKKNDCNYIFSLPQESDRLSEWDNSLSFIARGNGYANSLADVHLFERQRLHRKFDDLKVIAETNNSLLTETTINGIQYNILTLVNYQSGISYLASFSFPSNEKNLDTTSVNSFFNDISYSNPSVNYDDIDEEIKENPEDATLYLQKAKREFNFHNIEAGMIDANKALEISPLYGEAYYLRGYLHLALGDTIEACRDFHASVAEDYFADFELDEYCNTRKIAEALREENSPFKDFDPTANHIEYIDSIRNHEYMFLSGKPNEKSMSYLNQLNHMFMLEYGQLDSLYLAETGIIQVYSFGIICRKFPEQINSDHKRILKSKDEILVLTRDQKGPQSMPIKEIASMMYGSIKAMEEEKEMQSKTETEVQRLIKNYSKHPDSYEPISFEQFHVMHIADGETLKKEKGSEDYIIGHRYRIKDVNGNTVECYNTFKFDNEFRINIIEGEESNTFSAYPPRVQEWLDKYGRSLSDKEKKKLGIL